MHTRSIIVGSRLQHLAFLALATAAHASPWNIVAVTGQPAPGTPYLFSSFDWPAINARGDVSFVGSVRTDIPTTCSRGGTGCTVITSGAWIDPLPGPLRPIALQGDLLPNNAGPLQHVDSVYVNNSGNAAIRAVIATGQYAIYQTAGGNLDPVAVPNQTMAAGSPVFDDNSFIEAPYLTDDGTILFEGVQRQPNTQTFFYKEWVAKNGQLSTGPPISDDPFGFSSNGSVAFSRVVLGQAFDLGIYVGNLQSQQLAVREGTPAAGTNTVYGGQQQPNVNNLGQFVSTISLGPSAGPSAGSGIWTGTATSVSPLAVSGQTAPGTNAQFDRFSISPQINDLGQVVFSAALKGSGITSLNTQGIWKGVPGSIAKIVQQGDLAPGTNDTFSKFGLFNSVSIDNDPSTSARFVFNNRGQFAFTAALVGSDVASSNDTGIWETSPDGQLQLILREGEIINLGPNDSRQVAGFQLRFGYGSSLNDAGQLVVEVNFTDSSQAILVSNQLAVPEPAAFSLLAFALSLCATVRFSGHQKLSGRSHRDEPASL